VFSYIRSSARSVQTAVKDAVPMEFELKRARDLLDDIIPEMHANVRLIAQEEVEVNALKDDIARHTLAMADEKVRVQKLRDALAVPQVRYTFGGREFSRDFAIESLAQLPEQFDAVLADIWQEQRLSCPKRSTIGAYMLGTLEPAWQDYVAFHLDKLGCQFCRANLADLQKQNQAGQSSVLRQKILNSTAGFLRKG
jgi:hypothetical protein